MKPAKFKDSNIVLAKDQPEYEPLPALILQGREGIVVTCWKLSFWERLVVLFTGRIWCQQMTFKQGFQPQLPSVTQPFKLQT